MPHNGNIFQVNFDYLDPYYGDFQFNNLLKKSIWWAPAAGGWCTDLSQFNANNYPTGAAVLAQVPQRTYAIPLQRNPNNTYVCLGSGTGTIRINSSVEGYGSGVQVPGTFGNTTAWQIPFTVDPAVFTGVENFVLMSVGVTANDGTLNNLAIVHAADLAAYQAGEIFQAQFLAQMRATVGSIRVMNWGDINRSICATAADFAPMGAVSWNTWYDPQLYAGAASGGSPDYTVGAPPAGFTLANNVKIHCTLPTAPFPFLGVINRVSGSGTGASSVTLGGTSSGEWAIGNRISFIGTGTPRTWTNGGAAGANGFAITAVDTSVANQVTVNFTDPQGSSSQTIDGNNYLAAFVVQHINVAGSGSIPLGGPVVLVPGWDPTGITTLVYNQLLNCWFAASPQAGPPAVVSLPPIEMVTQMANEIGCHIWYSIPVLACDSSQASPNVPAVGDLSNLIDHVFGNFRDNLASGLMAIGEVANEVWNFGAPPTQYAVISNWFHIGLPELLAGNTDYQNQIFGYQTWYAMAVSLVGQRLAQVYGVAQSAVRTQTHYRFPLCWQYYFDFGNTDRTGETGWFTSAGGSPAWNWITDMSNAGYFHPKYYGTSFEAAAANLFASSNDPALLSWFIQDTGLTDTGLWNSATAYAGPSGSGLSLTTQGVWMNSIGAGDFFLATAPSTNANPYSSPGSWTQSTFPGGGIYNSQATRTFLDSFNSTHSLTPPLGYLMYEGGWSPDYGVGEPGNTTNFRQATNTSPTLQAQSIAQYQAYTAAGGKFYSEYLYAGAGIWAVWHVSLWSTLTQTPLPAAPAWTPNIPPRWSAMLQYNGAVLPVGPTVISVLPSTGAPAGGTSVVITGANLTGATAVMFGAVAATSFTVNNSTQITAISPAGTGAVNVMVTTPQGTSAAGVMFTYAAAGAGPTISSIVPNTGTSVGGTSVVITGTGFTGTTAVMFGPASATFTVNSDTQITATSPAGTGSASVTVTTPLGTSLGIHFTYTTQPPPVFAAPPINPGETRPAYVLRCTAANPGVPNASNMCGTTWDNAQVATSPPVAPVPLPKQFITQYDIWHWQHYYGWPFWRHRMWPTQVVLRLRPPPGTPWETWGAPVNGAGRKSASFMAPAAGVRGGPARTTTSSAATRATTSASSSNRNK